LRLNIPPGEVALVATRCYLTLCGKAAPRDSMVASRVKDAISLFSLSLRLAMAFVLLTYWSLSSVSVNNISDISSVGSAYSNRSARSTAIVSSHSSSTSY
jgi:Na+/glutamate symporter